jgi:hypothetical protein
MLRNHTLEERLTLSQDNKTQSDKFQGVAITRNEFLQGLVATRASTIDAIREANRRKS